MLPGAHSGLGRLPTTTGLTGVGHIHEGRAVHSSDDGVLAPGLGVGPPPDVVDAHATAAAEILDRHKRDEIHIAAPERGRAALGAVNLTSEHGFHPVDVSKHGVALGPAVPVPLEDQRGARTVVVPGHAGNQNPVGEGHPRTHPGTGLGRGLGQLHRGGPAARAVAGELVDAAPAGVHARRANPQRRSVRRHRGPELVAGRTVEGAEPAHLGPFTVCACEDVHRPRVVQGMPAAHEDTVFHDERGGAQVGSAAAVRGEFGGHIPPVGPRLVDERRTHRGVRNGSAHHEHVVG